MRKIFITALFILVAYVSSADAATVGLWTFDESSGNTAYDSSGYGNNGTVYGGATRTGDTPFSYLGNSALSFDGINDYINCGSSPALSLTTFTLEAWIKPETVGLRYIAIKGNEYAIELMDNSAYPKSWYTTGSDDIYHMLHCPTTIPLNTWSHIATTKDDNAFKLYVNGELKLMFNIPHSGVYSPGIPHTDDFIIGSCNAYNSFTGYPFDGLIDEVRISDVALSPEQLGYYQTAGNPVPEPATMLLFGIGSAAMVFARRKKRA